MTSSVAVVIVTAPPVAGTSNPASLTVDAGQTASFSVNATGGFLSYQWQKGGINLTNGPQINASTISGSTTSILTLTDVRAADSASYTCVVTNLSGSDTSSASVLTVNDPVPSKFISNNRRKIALLTAVRAQSSTSSFEIQEVLSTQHSVYGWYLWKMGKESTDPSDLSEALALIRELIILRAKKWAERGVGCLNRQISKFELRKKQSKEGRLDDFNEVFLSALLEERKKNLKKKQAPFLTTLNTAKISGNTNYEDFDPKI